MSTPEWPEEDTDRLRILWSEGHSAPEIGRRIGRSKNSVIGKAHRLNLPSRPSPIKRNGLDPIRPYKRRQVRCSGPVTLPPLLALLDDPILLTTPPRERRPPKPKPVVEAPRAARQSTRQCEFLDGDKPFTRCENKALFGYSYCENCCRRAYINWRSAAQEIAA